MLLIDLIEDYHNLIYKNDTLIKAFVDEEIRDNYKNIWRCFIITTDKPNLNEDSYYIFGKLYHILKMVAYKDNPRYHAFKPPILDDSTINHYELELVSFYNESFDGCTNPTLTVYNSNLNYYDCKVQKDDIIVKTITEFRLTPQLSFDTENYSNNMNYHILTPKDKFYTGQIIKICDVYYKIVRVMNFYTNFTKLDISILGENNNAI